MFHLRSCIAFIVFFLLLSPFPSSAIRSLPSSSGDKSNRRSDATIFQFAESPEYYNADDCPPLSNREFVSACDPSLIHIAMTLDFQYLRGSIAAVHSIIHHAACPEHIFFHFTAAEFDSATPRDLTRLVRSTFPLLNFRVYIFREDTVINLISSSIRQALENPLNYARNYLGDILDRCVDRVIYLDSDVILADDIQNLWSIRITGSKVIGAPEYCHANFTRYFTDNFWSDPGLTRVFGLNLTRTRTRTRNRVCYFNTGVMVMDLRKWREGQYRKKIEHWMELQKKRRIYELGSLPPFLLVFGGRLEAVDHRWNQHGLGGDNVNGSCRSLHPGPSSLFHWSGKDKPWVRLDGNKPCPLDQIWGLYDLHKSSTQLHQLRRRLRRGPLDLITLEMELDLDLTRWI